MALARKYNKKPPGIIANNSFLTPSTKAFVHKLLLNVSRGSHLIPTARTPSAVTKIKIFGIIFKFYSKKVCLSTYPPDPLPLAREGGVKLREGRSPSL